MGEFYIIHSEDELYHHGKKGMHWGVKNGPPYPLNREGLAKFKANAKKLGDKVAKGTDAVKKKAVAAKIKGQNLKNRVKAIGPARLAQGEARSKVAQKKMERHEKRMTKKFDKQEKKGNEDLHSMSDQDLQKRIARLQMERQYKNLMAERNAEIQQGKGYIRDLAKKTGKQMAENMAKGMADRAVKNALAKMDEKNRSDWERKYEKLKKDTKEIKALNEYLKTLNTNERYNAGKFNNESEDKDKKKK